MTIDLGPVVQAYHGITHLRDRVRAKRAINVIVENVLDHNYADISEVKADLEDMLLPAIDPDQIAALIEAIMALVAAIKPLVNV